MTNCKQCGEEFDNTPITAWGQEVTPVRCAKCRKLNRTINQLHSSYSGHYRSDSCEHGAGELNPGGYCRVCGSGRDFS